jgi:hypothetical protein
VLYLLILRMDGDLFEEETYSNFFEDKNMKNEVDKG